MHALSFKDMTGRILQDQEIAPGTIQGSCFSHEKPDTHVFPENMQGVTFLNCNLDNVYVPAGNTAVSCSQRRFLVQSDGMDWLVDENNNPIALLNPPGGN